MAKRKCYGYDIGLNGELTIVPHEAAVICADSHESIISDKVFETVRQENYQHPAPRRRQHLLWHEH